MGYKNGILLDKLILYLNKLIIALDRNNLICYIKLLVWLFPAFNAYGNSLKALVMRSFEYLQCRMRSYCCYLIIFWCNHIRGGILGYIKLSFNSFIALLISSLFSSIISLETASKFSLSKGSVLLGLTLNQ